MHELELLLQESILNGDLTVLPCSKRTTKLAAKPWVTSTRPSIHLHGSHGKDGIHALALLLPRKAPRPDKAA
jgi:hypothetical protein